MNRLVAMLLMAQALFAGQLYMSGKYDRVGSLTKEGGSQHAVYLRWDTIDGNFPTDVETIELTRDGTKIFEADPASMMRASQIRSIYQGKAQERRLFETLAALADSGDPACSGATLATFADKLIACSQDPFWRYMAARADFNVARVNYRGYLDEAVDALGGTAFDYELTAVNGAQRIVLGRVRVPKTVTRPVAATEFRQLMRANCGAPEYARDDYTVALGWQDGGQNGSERLLGALSISGYDLYRTRTNVTDPADAAYVLDMAALAASSGHDGRGRVRSDVVEKVNTTLITQSGSDANATRFLETLEDLRASGLTPGDQRYYYLVPRDFSGNYGATTRLLVTVPDRLPPPSPWDLQVVEAVNFDPQSFEDRNNTAQLIWSPVNVANYTDHYGNAKRFCNLSTLSPGTRLRFVDAESTCGDREVSVNLNVTHYRIYRFDSPQDAAAFQIDECGGDPGGVRVEATDAEWMTYRDDTVLPARVYWYRVASVAANGAISALSAPIRAMIPDRALPSKPEATLRVCEKRDTVIAHNGNARIEDNTGRVRQVRLACGDTVHYGELQEITARKQQCNEAGSLTFLDENGTVIAAHDFSPDSAHLGYVVEYTCEPRDVQFGNILRAWPTITFTDPRPKDLEFSLHYGGDRRTVKKRFGVTTTLETSEFNLSNLGAGELFCPALNAFNANNQVSPTLYLPCFGVASEKVPERPNVTALAINDGDIDATWQTPQESIAGTTLELVRQGSDQPRYAVIPHPDHLAADGELHHTFDVNLSSAPQTWCLRAKSVGLNARVSAWSAPLCVRQRAVMQKGYLPWPTLPEATAQPALPVTYADGLPRLHLERASSADCSIEHECGCRTLEALFRGAAQFVLYRQTVYADGNTTFTQVSPLIESLHCTHDANAEAAAVFENIEVVITPAGSGIHGVFVDFYYLDRYPHLEDEVYRYTAVYFDPYSHEPVRYAPTATLTAH